MKPENSNYLNEIQNYKDEIEVKSKAFYHTDLSSILENIVLKEKPEKDKNVLEKIFSDRTKTQKATVKALLEEIELREKLDSHLLKKIEEEISIQNTHLLNLNNLRINYNFDLLKDIGKIRIQLEDNILELNKEKRKEYLECWRDLMFLKKYLLSAFREYWDLFKRREILSGGLSEIIQNENRQGD